MRFCPIFETRIFQAGWLRGLLPVLLLTEVGKRLPCEKGPGEPSMHVLNEQQVLSRWGEPSMLLQTLADIRKKSLFISVQEGKHH